MYESDTDGRGFLDEARRDAGRTCGVASSVEESGGGGWMDPLRMEQSGENQAAACSICRGRSSLLRVDEQWKAATIIAIIARNSRQRTRQGYAAAGVKSRHFHANARAATCRATVA